MKATREQLRAVIATQTRVARLGFDIEGIMHVVAQRAHELTGAAGAVVELVDGDEMVYRAAVGTAQASLGLRISRNGSLSGLCVRERRTLRCDDVLSDDRVDREAVRRVGVASMIVVPLLHDDYAMGVLKVLGTVPSAFGDGDVELLELMSELVAASLYYGTRAASDELFRQATHDHLTGLANRALFYDRLALRAAAGERDHGRFAVLGLDADGLKPINDELGHAAGDAALKEIGARAVREVRREDTVARIGGDEFAILLRSLDSADSAVATALRIADRIDRPFAFEGRTVRLSASVGVAVYPDDGRTAQQLVEHADRAMYASKRTRMAERRPGSERDVGVERRG